MRIVQAEFVTSAVAKRQYPIDGLKEVAFVGRSNVGKSSLINTLTNRRKLVKVSGTPGKTRLVNFFLINNKMFFVDLPGYGYAKVSKKEKESWGRTIETYLLDRKELKKVLLLLDSRRVPNEDDILMYNWINHYGYEPVLVMTKIDKLKKSEIAKNEKVIRDALKIDNTVKIHRFSALKKIGIEELTNRIFENIIEEEQ